ncbi:unnamed protein product [Nyctereutes procyonoides]|uniref:(raccoon dog) hypothetical protein n=1 Tax=Nyctereutes procyonoides TaxID=34880 RepID=A0A811ZH20_NYCPR|nr:unnamed protein product [Nyctereutes procyonoides]
MGHSSSTTFCHMVYGGLDSRVGKFFREFKLGSQIVPQETINLIQSHIAERDLHKVVSMISDALRNIENTSLNFAYLKKMKCWEYDFFITISSTCFTINDVQLATTVRKVDSDLHNIKMSKPENFNKGKILQMICKDYVKHLMEANMSDAQIFIFSFEFNYDFQSLEITLLREVPAHKPHIFMQYYQVLITRWRSWGILYTSTGFTLGWIMHSWKHGQGLSFLFFFPFFFLKDFHVPVETLKANLMSPHLLSIEKEDESLEEKLLRYVEKFCSVSGGLIATGFYFRKTFYLQNYFLEIVANDVKVLLLKKRFFKDPEGSGQTNLHLNVGNEKWEK